MIIDLIHFSIGTCILHLTRYLIVFNIIHSILKDKYSSYATLSALLASGLLYSWITVEFCPAEYEVFYAFGSITLAFIVCIIFCEGRIPRKIITCIAAQVPLTLPALILQFFKELTGFGNIESLFETKIEFSTLMSYCLFMYVLSFVLVLFIRLFKIKVLKNEKEIKTAKSLYFFIFPITHILCLFSLTVSEQAMLESQVPSEFIEKFRFPSLLFNIICFAIDVSIVFFADRVNNLELKAIENEKKILANTMTYEQTIMLKEEKAELRKIKHDMSNLITTATGFIDIGKSDKAKEILKGTGTSILKGGGTNYCSDDTLNTVIYLKNQKATEFGVKMIVEISENNIIRIDGFDLCRLVHNIIDNSINAAQKSEEKISEIKISITNDFISISSLNSFVRDQKPTKKNSENHGYGTQIIKEIVKKYNGYYHTMISNNIYKTETVIDNKNC